MKPYGSPAVNTFHIWILINLQTQSFITLLDFSLQSTDLINTRVSLSINKQIYYNIMHKYIHPFIHNIHTLYQSSHIYITLAGNFSNISLLLLGCELARRRGNVGFSEQPWLRNNSTHSCDPELRAYHRALRPSWSTILTSAPYWKYNFGNVQLFTEIDYTAFLGGERKLFGFCLL